MTVRRELPPEIVAQLEERVNARGFYGVLGVFGAVGHTLLALAHRYAPANVTAPFLYQQVFYMAIFGYLVFGDVPAPAVWTGALVVVASGLYLFHRERSA